MKIEYEYEANRSGYCITPCPAGLKVGDFPNSGDTKSNNYVMVNSWVCSECQFHKKGSKKKKTIECTYFENLLPKELFEI